MSFIRPCHASSHVPFGGAPGTRRGPPEPIRPDFHRYVPTSTRSSYAPHCPPSSTLPTTYAHSTRRHTYVPVRHTEDSLFLRIFKAIFAPLVALINLLKKR